MTRIGDSTGALELEPEGSAFDALDAEAARLSRLQARAGAGDGLVRLVEMPGELRGDDPFTRMMLSQLGAAASGSGGGDRFDVPAGLDSLRWLVRAVRRRQPPRRRGEFVRESGWVRFGWGAVFVVWGVGGPRPYSASWSSYRPEERRGPSPQYRKDQPGADLDSWFADCNIWWASKGSGRRMAGIFASAGDELPLLAFEPFEPGLQRPERLFLWAEVNPAGQPGGCR